MHQFRKATEDQSEGNRILLAGTKSTMTRQKETVNLYTEERHKEIRTIIADADENRRADKRLLHTLTDLSSAQDQTRSINAQSIYAKVVQPVRACFITCTPWES